MPEIIVNGIPIQYPDPGTPPSWGEGATQFAVEVSTVLSDLVNPSDILETTFTIENNISVFTSINGLAFSTGLVRSAEVSYSILRTTASSTSGNIESGTIQAVYDGGAAAEAKWQLSIGNITGPGSGVTFTITDAGQVQYKSTNILGASYAGEMRFRAKTILST